MKRIFAVVMIVAVTMLGAPLAGVAHASETGGETGAMMECKCPPGNHYGHCDGKGKHKGLHKKGHHCEHMGH